MLDTNVILSAKLWGGKPLLPISARRGQALHLFTSEALIEELESVLTRSKMQQRLLETQLGISGIISEY